MIEKHSPYFIFIKKIHNKYSYETDIWQNEIICSACKTNIGAISNKTLKRIGEDFICEILLFCNNCNDFHRTDIKKGETT